MPVHIDDPGHYVVAAQIHLASARRELRPLGLFFGTAGRTHRHDLHDPVAFDHDVRRTEGGGASATDEDDVTQNELRIRPLAFFASRCRRHPWTIGIGGRAERGAKNGKKERAADRYGEVT